jgi:LAS superfamily LD-carboxypeptidase LdcB
MSTLRRYIMIDSSNHIVSYGETYTENAFADDMIELSDAPQIDDISNIVYCDYINGQIVETDRKKLPDLYSKRTELEKNIALTDASLNKLNEIKATDNVSGVSQYVIDGYYSDLAKRIGYETELASVNEQISNLEV